MARTNHAHAFESVSHVVGAPLLACWGFMETWELEPGVLVGRKLLENWVNLGRIAKNGLWQKDDREGKVPGLWQGKPTALEVHKEAIPLPASAWDSHQALEGEKRNQMKYIFITIIIIILSPIFFLMESELQSRKLLKLRVMVPPGQIKRELQTSRAAEKPQHRKYLQNELRIYGGWGFQNL